MNDYPHLSKLANAGETLSKIKRRMGGDAKAPLDQVAGGQPPPTITSEATKKIQKGQQPTQPGAPAAPPQQPKEVTAMHEAGHKENKCKCGGVCAKCRADAGSKDNMRVVGTAPKVKTVPHEATGEQAWKDMQDKIAAAYPALAKEAFNPAGLAKGWKGFKNFVGLGGDAAEAALKGANKVNTPNPAGPIKITPAEVAAATPQQAAGRTADTALDAGLNKITDQYNDLNVAAARRHPNAIPQQPGGKVTVSPADIEAVTPQQPGGKVTVSPAEAAAATPAAGPTQLPKMRIPPEEAFKHNWSSRAGKYVPSKREIPGHGSTPPGPQVRITPEDLNPADFFPKSSAYPALSKQAEIDWDSVIEKAKSLGLHGLGGAGVGTIANLFRGKDMGRGAITGGLTGLGYGAGKEVYDALQPNESWGSFLNPLNIPGRIGGALVDPLLRGGAGVGGGALGYQLAQGLQGEEEEDEDEKEKQLRALAKMSSAYPALTKQAAGLGTIAKDLGISTLTGSGLGALLNLIRGKDVIPGAVTGGLTLGGMNLGSHGGDALGGTVGGLAGMAGGGVGGYQLAQMLNNPEIMDAIKEKGGDVADWFSGDEEEPEKHASVYPALTKQAQQPADIERLKQQTADYYHAQQPREIEAAGIDVSKNMGGGPYHAQQPREIEAAGIDVSKNMGGGKANFLQGDRDRKLRQRMAGLKKKMPQLAEGGGKYNVLQQQQKDLLQQPSPLMKQNKKYNVLQQQQKGLLQQSSPLMKQNRKYNVLQQQQKDLLQQPSSLMKQNMAMYPALTKQAFEMPEGISDAWSGIKDYLGENPKALNAILGGALGAGIGGFAGGGKGALGGLLAGGGAGYVADDVSKYFGDYLSAPKSKGVLANAQDAATNAWDVAKWTLPPYWAYRAFT